MVICMDDILIRTQPLEAHLCVLFHISKFAVRNKLKLKLDKCEFVFTKIEYLGYVTLEREVSSASHSSAVVTWCKLDSTMTLVQRIFAVVPSCLLSCASSHWYKGNS
nr:uncharacterized protein LOC117225639 [Megalopta genalis]